MLAATLARVLTSPSADDLWNLRAGLLEAGVHEEAEVWGVIGEFHAFLDRLATGTSSRDFSELASRMDVSAVSGVLLEQLLEKHDARELAVRVLSGVLSEGLMVLATRQHVRAWQGELAAVFRGAAWYLYGAMWRWTEGLRPEVDAGDRRRLLDRLFAPLLEPGSPEAVRAVLVGRLFQILLVAHLAAALRTPHLRPAVDIAGAGAGWHNQERENAERASPVGASDGEEKA